jgi:hypothetical protein
LEDSADSKDARQHANVHLILDDKGVEIGVEMDIKVRAYNSGKISVNRNLMGPNSMVSDGVEAGISAMGFILQLMEELFQARRQR